MNILQTLMEIRSLTMFYHGLLILGHADEKVATALKIGTQVMTHLPF